MANMGVGVGGGRRRWRTDDGGIGWTDNDGATDSRDGVAWNEENSCSDDVFLKVAQMAYLESSVFDGIFRKFSVLLQD